MRHLVPLLAFMACSTLALSAHAEEEPPPTAPAEAPRARVAPPPVSAKRPTLKRPTSVDEYDDRLSTLGDAVRDSAGAERAANQAELDQMERWYDEDVYRRGPVLGAGIALLGIGPLLGLGAVGMAGGGGFDGAKALGVGALAAVLVGIPLTIVGAQRSVRSSPKPQTDSLVPASLVFTVGPSSLGLQGSF